jgi:peptidoglycan hydrolase-like protein with peptidoglycan-binding domain
VVNSPSDSVKVGDSGPGVTQIQTALVAQGYKVTVDGKFGAQTSRAVIDFQSKNALKQDGIVGPATWAKLQAAPTATTAKGATTTTVKRTTTTT